MIVYQTVPRFGDSTNYTEIESDGTIVFHGDATVYDDMQVSLNNIKFPGSDYPNDTLYNMGIGGGVEFPVLGFAVNEYIFFDVQTSHSMELNTVLDDHIHFILPNTTNIGDKFQFQLDVVAAGVNGEFAAPSGSPFTNEYTVQASDNTIHRIFDIANIPASNTTVSTIYKCKLTRISASANEYGSEVYLLFTDCHYKKDMIGSHQEYVK